MSSRLPFLVSGSRVYPHTPDEQKIQTFADQLDREVAEHLDALPEWLQAELLSGWLSAHGIRV